MLRAVLAVIIGYVVVFIIVFGTFSAVYLAMGAERAFVPGTFHVSTMWIVISSVLGLIAAIAGGAVCAAIARSPTPPKILAAIALLLGLALAIPVVMESGASGPATRPATVDNMTAMANAKQPKVTAIINPFIGAIGVLIGATMVRRARRPLRSDQPQPPSR